MSTSSSRSSRHSRHQAQPPMLESALEGEITDHLGSDQHDPAGKNDGKAPTHHVKPHTAAEPLASARTTQPTAAHGRSSARTPQARSVRG
ncbi:hypothetical protein [Streptomyces sp. NPDC046161]|uniref:hypothetical protein n=1 Tax=Streptomyces sp. NPDC046161 TaxID=3155132 RepID=UPI003407AC06